MPTLKGPALNGVRRRGLVALALCGLVAASPTAQTGVDPAGPLEQAVSAAESRLAAGDLGAAEQHYRVALFEGWMLLGRLDRMAGRVPEAREAIVRAADLAPSAPRAVLALASAQLELGDAARAAATLTGLRDANPGDLQAVRLLVRALAMAGQGEAAVRRLDQALEAAPGDPELAFVLATDYLWLKRADVAERLLGQVIAYRPVAETHVLVGRAYRDAGEYVRARRELERALALDPRVRRAHYYLGTVLLADPAAGPARIDAAIAEFREELTVAGEDPLVLDQLGLALLEAGRPEDAVPALEGAVRADPRASYLHHLGRAQLAAGRPAQAVDSLRRALDLVAQQGEGSPDLETIHYRLGTALRSLGPEHQQAAAMEFAEAKRLAAHWTDNTRQLTALDAGPAGPSREAASLAPSAEAPPAAPLPLDQRKTLETRVRAALARSYLNLGVMQARTEQFARAAELLALGASLDPELPGVQYALGVARFNAGAFAEAIAPLSRAVAQDPPNRASRRLLAMASINGEDYARAAQLLQDDPQVSAEPPLQMALGLALAHIDRATEAEAIFTRLLRAHGPSAPLFVGLGEALAQQGKLDGAMQAASKALELDPRVAEARTTLGFVHYRQGLLQEAEADLRAELAARPRHVRSQRLLAAVLDAQGRTDDAIPLLREILTAWPDHAEAHLGLSRAYDRLGMKELAVQELDAYRRLTPKQ